MYGTISINRYRYLVNNTTNIFNDVYQRMITTTCFGLFRPSSGFHPKQPLFLIIKTIDDEISPSLHNRINLINTNILSDENLMMVGLGRNVQLSSSSNKHLQNYLLCSKYLYLFSCMSRISIKANIQYIKYTEHAAFNNDNTLLHEKIRDPTVSLYCKFFI